MKQSISILALLLLIGTGAFAAGSHPGKEKNRTTDLISLNTLENNKGVRLFIRKQDPGPAYVTIFDTYGNAIFNDHLPEALVNERSYILEEEGVYFFVITSHHQRVRKTIEVGQVSRETISVRN